MKLFNKVKNGFIFQEIDNIASVSYNDIACVLFNPSPVAQTARLSNIFKFSDNLTNIILQNEQSINFMHSFCGRIF